MQRTPLYLTITIFVIAGIVAGYLYWRNNLLESQAVQEPVTQPEPPKTEIRQEIIPPAVETKLPDLANSDDYILDKLSGMISDKNLLQLLINKNILRNLVATVDELPRRKIAQEIMPLKPVAGKFLTQGKDANLTIHSSNAERYTPYVQLAEAVDTRILVELYVRMYPLLQQTYVELGYPKKYFNDRLLFVLDDLQKAPVSDEPIKLVKFGRVYKYANPAIEELSIGQRIMVRMGTANATKVKAKLKDFKTELQKHTREKVVDNSEQ